MTRGSAGCPLGLARHEHYQSVKRGELIMRLGLMTHHIPRDSIEEVATAIAGLGLAAVQLNLESAGLDPPPAALPAETCRRIGAAFARHGIAISAVSGTFNAIHPDLARRQEETRRVGLLAARCQDLGTEVITLCTGTRNPDHMWRHHPDNALP